MVITVPPGLPTGAVGLEGGPVGHARGGRNGPAGPLVGAVAVDRLGDRVTLLAEVGQRGLELDRLGLLGVGLGGREDLDLGEHEVAVGRTAGALARQAVVGQDLQPKARDVGQVGLGGDRVDRLVRVLARREDRPVGLLGSAVASPLAWSEVGSSVFQRTAGDWAFSQSAIFLARTVDS